jgi:EamA-like transporter family
MGSRGDPGRLRPGRSGRRIRCRGREQRQGSRTYRGLPDPGRRLLGLNFAATKFAALSIPPLLLVAFRFCIGGMLRYGILRVLEPRSRLGREDLLPMAALGCLGVVTTQTGFTFSLSLTSAASTGLVFFTAPVGHGHRLLVRPRAPDPQGRGRGRTLHRGGGGGLLRGALGRRFRPRPAPVKPARVREDHVAQGRHPACYPILRFPPTRSAMIG